jgi:signal transduction histidine kinase
MDFLQARRHLFVILAWALYVASWGIGHASFLNDVFAVWAFGPLLLTAWLYGLRGALVATLLFFPIQAGLFLAGGHQPGWDALAGRDGAAGLGVMALVTLAGGWAAGSQRRMRDLVRSQADLVAVVSHEVRTPLTGVIGLARELEDRWTVLSEDTRRELVELISQSAGDMFSIVEDLLTAAKAEQGQLTIDPTVTDLSEVAASVVHQLRLPAPVEGQALAWADPHRVRQVIRNLVVNASRYGGPLISLQAGSNGVSVFVEVADNGVGIAPERIESLFDPHAINRQHRDSHGLGLALSRRLAILMGGDLGYTRVEERTVFKLTLPKAVVATMPARSLSREGSGLS